MEARKPSCAIIIVVDFQEKCVRIEFQCFYCLRMWQEWRRRKCEGEPVIWRRNHNVMCNWWQNIFYWVLPSCSQLINFCFWIINVPVFYFSFLQFPCRKGLLTSIYFGWTRISFCLNSVIMIYLLYVEYYFNLLLYLFIFKHTC